MSGVFNGNGTWLTRGALGLLVTISLSWVSCQQAALRDIDHKQQATEQELAQVRRTVTIHDQVLLDREQYIQQLKELDKTTTGDLNRLEIRMVRLEMMMQQMMLAENVRPPRGLPPIPKSEDEG